MVHAAVANIGLQVRERSSIGMAQAQGMRDRMVVNREVRAARSGLVVNKIGGSKIR